MTNDVEFATVAIYVDDVPATLEFYRRAMALEPSYYDAELGFALLGPRQSIAVCSHAAGRLMMEDGYQEAVAHEVARTELAFWAEDVASACERAAEAGAAILAPPRRMPWGQCVAYVRAPEGTIIAFLTRVANDAPDQRSSD
jgi:predicted enzyme related to lactoylglutathione lyase